MRLFKPTLDEIKNHPNDIWNLVEPDIKTMTGYVARQKGLDRDELYQQAYLYFRSACEKFEPNYQGKDIPFDRYMYKNVWMNLRAYAQSYHFKRKREPAKEVFPRTDDEAEWNVEERETVARCISVLDDKYATIVRLWMKGYKQTEIADIIGLSQSRICVLLQKAFRKMREVGRDEEEEI
ncbi:sigma-70 family RNA polymerase sigma factor [Alicyclobacillus tolerans]|uniref:sigma-70 family RNA polymerase sigma factor n=1 Tax=Alicyclobacillus tolerans TaxID=90970 RepID=UPI001F1BBC70|nr:sigma-70 family RNA polymerase sigma factor [Alicyclobacillus tolerans]MCF8567016.1 sigma-70 family RNA polymerase sigma factor [Alicyclobacillus tolerans]